MITSSVSMPLCRSRPPGSRAQREIAVSEVAPYLDQLIHLLEVASRPCHRGNGNRDAPPIAAVGQRPSPRGAFPRVTCAAPPENRALQKGRRLSRRDTGSAEGTQAQQKG